MLCRRRVLICAALIAGCAAAGAQDPKQIVRQAVKTELAADAADHTRWLYYEVDRKPDLTVSQWVAQTGRGDLRRVLERNGQPLSQEAQRRQMQAFAGDQAMQAKQRKAGQHDDSQAAQMLNMLPDAFLWTKTSEQGGDTILQFTPNPHFHAPSYESRVFAAMQGEMTVNKVQHRIVSLKGRLIHDVKFGFGLLGELRAGGTFDVERRELSRGVWQITETHVHIAGRALLFKSISEQEDDEKSKFSELPGNISFDDAEKRLMAQNRLMARNK